MRYVINQQYYTTYDNPDVSNALDTIGEINTQSEAVNLYFNSDMTNFANGSNITSVSTTGEAIVNYDLVTNMKCAFYNCLYLSGLPVCGPNVTDMSYAYYNCRLLTGYACGDKVKNMRNAYCLGGFPGGWTIPDSCTPVCGSQVTDFSWAYKGRSRMYGAPVCGDKVTSMLETYYGCSNLTGSPVCGPNVTNMSNAYHYCYNLTGGPACGDKVMDMYNAYEYCNHLTGSPVCGPNVTNMRRAYNCCFNLTGDPVCGDKVTDMSSAYYLCNNLTGSPVCGPNVANMYGAYRYCNNLTGSPVCGDKVTDMSEAYCGCNNLTGSSVCGPNVMNMEGAYRYCNNLTGSSACGNKVTDMREAYYLCKNLTGFPVCGPNVTNMEGAYSGCYNLTGPIACGPSVTDMNGAYWDAYMYTRPVGDVFMYSGGVLNFNKYSLPSSQSYRLNIHVIKDSVTNSSIYSLGGWIDDPANNSYYNAVSNRYVYYYANGPIKTKYYNGSNIEFWNNDAGTPLNFRGTQSGKGIKMFDSMPCIDYGITNMSNAFAYIDPGYQHSLPRCGPDVTNMADAYSSCINLIDSPYCGPSVIDMSYAYGSCIMVSDSPVCGPNVINFAYAYAACYELPGPPVCGDKVEKMTGTYGLCYKLAGSPVCGPNVSNMYGTYNYCRNLTGAPVCGPKVTDMDYTYGDCCNLTGNLDMQSDSVARTKNMLYNHNALNTINIYVRKDTTTNSALYSNGVGCGAWTLDTTNERYYNEANNIYVYYNWDGVLHEG